MIETKFKDTEIGKIPEEWEVKTLGELGKFSKGAGISRADSNSGNIPAIRYGEIYTDHNDYIRNFKSFISDKIAKTSHLLHNGDILFTASGETKEDIGKSVAFINDYEAYAGGDLIILSPGVNYDPIFMGYQTNSKIVQEQKSAKGQGDAVVHIVTSDLSSIKIPFPSFDEQRRIATSLSDVDALIAAVEKKIEKKKLIKQGAMQQLLTGKKRLNGYKGEWVEKRLGDGISFQPGFPFASKYFNNSIGIRLIKNRDLKSDDTIVYYQGEHPKDFLVQDGDLLVGMDGDFLPCLWNKGPALLNQRVGRLNIIGKWDRRFLYYYLYEPLLKMQEGTGATTVKHLSHTDIEKIILPIPDPSEQRAIASVLSNMDSEITALEHKRDKLKELKQGMMQQLLTGKIRLVRCSG